MYSIIIPHYKKNYLLNQCLNSIKESLIATEQQTSIEIIIVDNQATEISKRFINEYQTKNSNLAIKPIYNKKNLGFAKAVNQGIKKAYGKYIVVINNDIKLDENWFNAINQAISKYNRQEISTFFGKVLNEYGTKIESVGLKFKPWGKAINIGNKEAKITKYSQVKKIWGAPASAVVYKKTALEEVGLFNPYFFAYLEDVEINLRLKAEGFKTLYIPEAISYHQGGQTADSWPDFRQRMTARNWWYIIILRYPVKAFCKYLPQILLEQLKLFFAIKSWKWKLWVVKEIIISLPQLIKNRSPVQLKGNLNN